MPCRLLALARHSPFLATCQGAGTTACGGPYNIREPPVMSPPRSRSRKQEGPPSSLFLQPLVDDSEPFEEFLI
jgi:hypothetical protein